MATSALLEQARVSADAVYKHAMERTGHGNGTPLALLAIAAELRVLTLLLEARDAD